MWMTTDCLARRSRNQTPSILQEATEETEIDPEERGGGHSVNGMASAIICAICGSGPISFNRR